MLGDSIFHPIHIKSRSLDCSLMIGGDYSLIIEGGSLIYKTIKSYNRGNTVSIFLMYCICTNLKSYAESDIRYRLARIDVLKIGKLGIIFNHWADRYPTPTVNEACNSHVRAQSMRVNLGQQK